MHSSLRPQYLFNMPLNKSFWLGRKQDSCHDLISISQSSFRHVMRRAAQSKESLLWHELLWLPQNCWSIALTPSSFLLFLALFIMCTQIRECIWDDKNWIMQHRMRKWRHAYAKDMLLVLRLFTQGVWYTDWFRYDKYFKRTQSCLLVGCCCFIYLLAAVVCHASVWEKNVIYPNYFWE